MVPGRQVKNTNWIEVETAVRIGAGTAAIAQPRQGATGWGYFTRSAAPSGRQGSTRLHAGTQWKHGAG